jgi:hypothetical protein
MPRHAITMGSEFRMAELVYAAAWKNRPQIEQGLRSLNDDASDRIKDPTILNCRIDNTVLIVDTTKAKTVALCRAIIEEPLAAEFRGQLSHPEVTALLRELLLTGQVSGTLVLRTQQAKVDPFLTVATSCACASCALAQQKCTILRALYRLNRTGKPGPKLNWHDLHADLLNPDCGLPLAALTLYISAVVQSLKLDNRQRLVMEW